MKNVNREADQMAPVRITCEVSLSDNTKSMSGTTQNFTIKLKVFII